jgi:hypothetical protein
MRELSKHEGSKEVKGTSKDEPVSYEIFVQQDGYRHFRGHDSKQYKIKFGLIAHIPIGDNQVYSIKLSQGVTKIFSDYDEGTYISKKALETIKHPESINMLVDKNIIFQEGLFPEEIEEFQKNPSNPLHYNSLKNMGEFFKKNFSHNMILEIFNSRLNQLENNKMIVVPNDISLYSEKTDY